MRKTNESMYICEQRHHQIQISKIKFEFCDIHMVHKTEAICLEYLKIFQRIHQWAEKVDQFLIERPTPGHHTS